MQKINPKAVSSPTLTSSFHYCQGLSTHPEEAQTMGERHLAAQLRGRCPTGQRPEELGHRSDTAKDTANHQPAGSQGPGEGRLRGDQQGGVRAAWCRFKNRQDVPGGLLAVRSAPRRTRAKRGAQRRENSQQRTRTIPQSKTSSLKYSSICYSSKKLTNY